MLNYFYGAATFYALAAILLLTIVDSTDPERPNASVWFSLVWPFIAVVAIFEMVVYGPGRGDE